MCEKMISKRRRYTIEKLNYETYSEKTKKYFKQLLSK